MDDGKSEDESGEILEAFRCCICLELLHKPVVLACGHTSCFWCVHHSMSFFSESHCPICRAPYYHFPSICHLLHLLLMKLYPHEYRRRGHHTLENEKETESFSPQLDAPPEDHNTLSPPDTNTQSLSVSDAVCSHCGLLLLRPLVLNCGHVFCEGCITITPDKMAWCNHCETRDPRGVPRVCLQLDHFLQETFSREYGSRRSSHPHRGDDDDGDENSPVEGQATEVHIGIGCDSCGMYPITGERHRCRDCVEKVGFDLCGDCHLSGPKSAGRFNQHHTPAHQFEKIHVHLCRELLEQFLDASAVPLFSPSPDASIDHEVHPDPHSNI